MDGGSSSRSLGSLAGSLIQEEGSVLGQCPVCPRVGFSASSLPASAACAPDPGQGSEGAWAFGLGGALSVRADGGLISLEQTSAMRFRQSSQLRES